MFSTMPEALPMLNNAARVTLIGRDAAGRVVAVDRAPHPTRAEPIARTWRDAGLAVQLTPDPPHRPVTIRDVLTAAKAELDKRMGVATVAGG